MYRTQRKRGTRYVSEHSGDRWGGMLPILDVILPNLKELSTVSLGVIDVPISKVRGTVASGRASAFAGNFCPILPDNSEFALKWNSLFNSHVSVGIHDACVGMEYLGEYYITEGHKRVSVLSAINAPSIQIDTQRIIPPDDAVDTDAQIYKEFLNFDVRTPLRGMWFSKPGSYTELYNMASGLDSELKTDDVLYDAYYDFRVCYYDIGLETQPCTTGDALLAYSRIYGLPYKKDRVELNNNMRTLEKRIGFIYSPTPLEKATTFYGDFSHAALILGALAGSFSTTNRVGCGDDMFDADALKSFSDGVKMTNVHANVFTSDFAGHDADIALLPYTGEERGPGVPGMFARLVGLTVPHGYISEYYAGLSLDFMAFYNSKDPSLPDIHSAGSRPTHIELGLDSGFLRLHLNKPVLLPQTLKLVEILKK